MFRFTYLIIFSNILHSDLFSQTVQPTPIEITKSFIADYKIWNDQAQVQYEKEKEKADIEIEEAYQQLITKYCKAGKNHQPLAFGSESIHHPELEKIISEKMKGNRAIVKTEYKKTQPIKIIDHFEYHFIKISNQWFLEEVYYLDKEGKYEGL